MYKRDVKATLLGTGSAWPIPRPGCACLQCEEARSAPRERRTRSGLHLDTAVGPVLFDTSPDLLLQLERERLSPDVRAVVISHHHHDHWLGLHDLCHVRSKDDGLLVVHAGASTRALIASTFANLLRPGRELIELRDWSSGTVLDFGDVRLEGFETQHREEAPTVGALLRTQHAGREVCVAYATDMGAAEPSSRAGLVGADAFFGDGTFLGAAGYGHPGTDRTIQIARSLEAARIVLTHVGHWGVRREDALRDLPADVAVCRDGDDLLSFLA